MRINQNDQVLSSSYASGDFKTHNKKINKNAEEQKIDQTVLVEDEIYLKSGRRRSELDPGNVPAAVSKTWEAQQDTPLQFTDNISYQTKLTGYLSDKTITDNHLADEVLNNVFANSNKWVTAKFMFDAREAPNIKNLKLVGSFNTDTGQYDATWNNGKGIAMYDDGTMGDEKASDGIFTTQVRLDADDSHEFQWGVKGDVYDKEGRLLSRDRWLIMTEDPPKFKVSPEGNKEFYAPLSNHLMGVHRVDKDGISFRTWSPEAGSGELKDFKMYLDIYDDKSGRIKNTFEMQKDEKTGNWSYESPKGWKELEGCSYQYSVRNSKGEPLLTGKDGKKTPVTYSDPYSRFLQGQQRGLERILVDPILGVETGWYDASCTGGPNYTINPEWGRFTVDAHPKADNVRLVFKDENGRQITRDELISRLGKPDLKDYNQATQAEKRNADVLKNWQLDLSGKVTDYKWIDNVNEDGSIEMKKVGNDKNGTAWVTSVNNFPKLVGLKYEFHTYENGKLIGDINKDGKFSDDERKLTPFNDPYSNIITAKPGAERRSLIKESNYIFKNDAVPRKENDFRKYVIYEAHIGSFMSTKDNAHPCSFDDLMNNLDYIDKLGANTIELLPFNEFGGKRDWGYTPDFYFAGAEAYGFEMPREKAVKLGVIRKDQETDKESVWISGTDAVKLFIDEAHRRGFNVFSDVVYNHTSGKADADNPLWMIDGDKQSFFKWWDKYNSDTLWGQKPNYSDQAVKDFFANNAAQQVEEFHVDGIRFDFTQVLHDTGNTGEKREGMNTLRQINRSLQFIKPDTFTYTAAEDFTQNWLVAADLDKSEWQGQGDWAMEKKGMGFSGVWNAPFHHDLLGAIENTNPEKNMDRLMDSILNHKGVSSWEKGVIFSHSHDEVGNSGTWVGRAAAHSRDDSKVMQPYPLSVVKSAAAITLTSAGVPMLFQGEEFVANNDFKHGITSTWGADYNWLDFNLTPDRLDNFKRIASLSADAKAKEAEKLPSEEKALFEKYCAMNPETRNQAESLSAKAGIFKCYKDLIALRDQSSAINASNPIKRLYTHNIDRVMAYSRDCDKENYIVVTNFADTDRNNYRIDLPQGKWKEIFNTNARAYGGNGLGNGGGIISGNGITLPAGSTVILKKA